MKLKSTSAIFALALAMTLASGHAQDSKRQKGSRRPMHPVIAALDANKDRVIDDQEMAGATAALKSLDKNSDGKLTREETAPPRREGRGPRGKKKNQQ